MPTGRPHYDRIAAELTADFRAVLSDLVKTEEASGGFFHRKATEAVDGFLDPHIPEIVDSILGKMLDRYGKMNLDDAVEMLNGLKTERP